MKKRTIEESDAHAIKLAGLGGNLLPIGHLNKVRS